MQLDKLEKELLLMKGMEVNGEARNIPSFVFPTLNKIKEYQEIRKSKEGSRKLLNEILQKYLNMEKKKNTALSAQELNHIDAIVSKQKRNINDICEKLERSISLAKTELGIKNCYDDNYDEEEEAFFVEEVPSNVVIKHN